MSTFKLFALYAVIVFSLAIPANATDYYVDANKGSDSNSGTAGFPKKSISAAITVASNYDTITVYDGTYIGSANRDLQPGSKILTIQSYRGPESCIIDAQGLGRAFYFIAAPAETLISGFTIRNGYNDQTFSGGGGGGAVFMHLSFCTIENCIIEDSTGLNGGAMLIRNSSAKIKRCTFKNNSVSYTGYAVTGGAVYLFDNTDVSFNDCVFSGNQCLPGGYNGGAIFKNRGTDSFENCIFEGNYSYNNAGVFYIERGDSYFTNCVFYGNEARVNASCFYIVYPMQVTSTSVTVKNSIFWNNTSMTNTDAVVRSGAITDGVLNYSYCVINPSRIDADGIVNVSGVNINTNPLFASPGYMGAADWVSGDYHLKSMVGRFDQAGGNWVQDTMHSPCIDAGDPADPVGQEPVPNEGIINMGAYGGTNRASKSPDCVGSLPADLTGDCRVDIKDFAMLAASWMTCNIIPADFCW